MHDSFSGAQRFACLLVKLLFARLFLLDIQTPSLYIISVIK